MFFQVYFGCSLCMKDFSEWATKKKSRRKDSFMIFLITTNNLLLNQVENTKNWIYSRNPTKVKIKLWALFHWHDIFSVFLHALKHIHFNRLFMCKSVTEKDGKTFFILEFISDCFNTIIWRDRKIKCPVSIHYIEVLVKCNWLCRTDV